MEGGNHVASGSPVLVKMNALRAGIAAMVEDVSQFMQILPAESPREVGANIMLGIRHLEDAAMRFGKGIQADQGGVSPLGGRRLLRLPPLRIRVVK